MSPERNVIVIGASAGGVEILLQLLKKLPADLGAAVAVTIHRSPTLTRGMAEIFGRVAKLDVVEPSDGQRFEAGRVYLAPADFHMSLADSVVRLDRGPKQHHTRPAVDPLFQSAAEVYGSRVIGVIFSGNLSDGVTGLIRIKLGGGLTLAQDPDEAAYPSIPLNALIYDDVDLVFRLSGLPDVLRMLVRGDSVRDVAEASGSTARVPNGISEVVRRHANLQRPRPE